MDRKQGREARRADAAARRADLDGSGPTAGEREPARFPGATAKFALLGEVLLTGVLVALVGIAVVTLPVALAAGVRHLRRFIRAEGSSMAQFFGDVKSGLAGGIGVGAVAALLGLILSFDIAIAGSGLLPGGEAMAVVGWVGLAALGVALLGAAGLWSPETGWRGAVRALPGSLVRDIPGALYLAATAGFVGVATWALAPLIVPALGCAALAVVAIPERPRRPRG